MFTDTQVTTLSTAIQTSEKGANSGVATLDTNGLVPAAQLPSYVDDVLEFTNVAAFPATGMTGKIYIDKDTSKTWRWSGTAYVEISDTMSAADINTLYEGQADTNKFTDSEKTQVAALVGAELLHIIRSKAQFDSEVIQRRRTTAGSGDIGSMDFSAYFTAPATIANELTLEARFRCINGIEFRVPQKVLTLPAASAVSTLLSNQTLVMFEVSIVDITTSDTFYIDADGDSNAIVWSTATANHVAYAQGNWNNMFEEDGLIKQYVFKHVVTNLTQDYSKGDPQAITDAGYTRGTNGDNYIHWTKVGIEAVALCRVQRRNQGAVEPILNPQGTALFGDALRWYATTDARATLVNCFTSVGDGSIAGAASGRNDAKFYDAVYSSDIDDLRMSARKVPHIEIRKHYKSKAIAGDVKGFEGVPFTLPNSNTNTGVGNVFTVQNTNGVAIGNFVWVENTVDNWAKYTITAFTSNSITVNTNVNRVVGTILIETVSLHLQHNPTWTSIACTPDRFLTTYPNGIEGQWLPYIPANGRVYLMHRKVVDSSDFSACVVTSDNGTTFTTNDRSAQFNSTTNTDTANWSTNTVVLYTYKIASRFTKDAVNSRVLDLGGVFATNRNTTSGHYSGALLINSLINKVLTTTLSTSLAAVEMPIGAHSFKHDTHELHSDAAFSQSPAHETINLVASTGPAGKVLDYLTESNGIAKMMYVYKEMIFDTDWGDNNQFEVISNQATLVDDNGNNAVYGTASFDTQFYATSSLGGL